MDDVARERQEKIKIGLVIVIISFALIVTFAAGIALDWFAGTSAEKCAIDLVKNHVPSTQTTVNPLTTEDLVKLEVNSLTAQGHQARVVWGSTDNGNGWHVVTARFECVDPFKGWDELYSITWGVNLDTNEIMGIDTWVDV